MFAQITLLNSMYNGFTPFYIYKLVVALKRAVYILCEALKRAGLATSPRDHVMCGLVRVTCRCLPASPGSDLVRTLVDDGVSKIGVNFLCWLRGDVKSFSSASVEPVCIAASLAEDVSQSESVWLP